MTNGLRETCRINQNTLHASLYQADIVGGNTTPVKFGEYIALPGKLSETNGVMKYLYIHT